MGETHGCRTGEKRLMKPFEMDETERLIIYSEQIGMTAERLAKNFEQMVITSEWLKKFSNGRPERLNGGSNISNGWSWTARQKLRTDGNHGWTAKKNFER